MKCKTAAVAKDDGFLPFNLIISVESREEAQALYAIFNITKNGRLFKSGEDEKVKHAIEEHGNFYINQADSVIANGITYAQFYWDEK